MEKFKTEKVDDLNYGSKSAIYQDGMREQLDWIRRQLQYYSFSDKYRLKYDLKRGEIYEIDFGININAEFSNRHFGVVLADSDANNPLVTVCPLKSNKGSVNSRSDVDLGQVKDLRSINSTVAVVNQIRTVDKLRIYMKRSICRPIYHLSDSDYVTNDTIMRLENDKMNMIINAYLNYINGKRIE